MAKRREGRLVRKEKMIPSGLWCIRPCSTSSLDMLVYGDFLVLSYDLPQLDESGVDKVWLFGQSWASEC